MMTARTGLTLTGALVSSVLASACCLGPLVLTVLGLGGAATAIALAPYRPYMLAMTVVLLGAAFYMAYFRPTPACAPGEACDMPRAGRVGKIVLWAVTLLVLLAGTFPYYSIYLF